MKRFYNILCVLMLAAVAVVGCSEEEVIVPTGNYSPIRGAFPQGDTKEDSIIGEISKQYGVYLIYKDVTEPDLNREWLSAGTGPVYVAGKLENREDACWSLPGEHLPFYVNFFNNHIFPNITEQLAKTALPLKIYMLDNLRAEPRKLGAGETEEDKKPEEGEETPGTGGEVKQISLRIGNFDNWAISFTEKDIFGGNSPAEYEEKMKVQRCKFIYRLIANAMEKGEIVVPDEFWEGFPFTTPDQNVFVEYFDPRIVGNQEFEDNKGEKGPLYYMYNLGIVKFIYEGFGTATTTANGDNIREGEMWYKPTTYRNSKYFAKNGTTSFDLSHEYIKNALWLRHDDEKNEILETYPAEYKLIHQKFDIIIKMLNDYGIDTRRIAAGK